MPVHFLPSAVIHLLLLLLQEAETLSDGVAARHWTISQLAALRVNAQQRPYPLANLASARSLDLAVLAVLEVVLHLCAILRSAGRSIALGGMLDELDVELNVSLPLPTLVFGEAAAAVIVGTATLDGDRLHLVRTGASVGIGVLVAFAAKIKIWTGIAVPAISREDLLATRTARLYEFGSPAIMKMPKNHHRGVFCSPELVELIVVASTKVQEGLAIVQELAI